MSNDNDAPAKANSAADPFGPVTDAEYELTKHTACSTAEPREAINALLAERRRAWLDAELGRGLAELVADRPAAERERDALRARVERLELALAEVLDALDELHDWQNGPPLIKYEKEWRAADQKASAVLRKHGRLPQALGNNDNEEAQ